VYFAWAGTSFAGELRIETVTPARVPSFFIASEVSTLQPPSTSIAAAKQFGQGISRPRSVRRSASLYVAFPDDSWE
jgi:hypothetical protein